MKTLARVLFVPITLIAIGILCTGCLERQYLFNGRDLTGWKLYVADENVNVNDVWSVKKGAVHHVGRPNAFARQTETPGVIHCVGKPNGYIRTESAYSNYKLHLEWRWVEEPTNSGVLLHASSDEKIWPECIEAQLEADNAGDFVLIEHTGVTVGGIEHHDPNEMYVTVKKKYDSTEKKPGNWNNYDIYCEKDSIFLCVNGKLQNLARKTTKTEGWICLQSEGSPIQFRNIYIDPIKPKWWILTEKEKSQYEKDQARLRR